MRAATWLIADPHFGHRSIIEMCNRPFDSVEDMDQAMARSWRAVVKPNDNVLVVGDFAHRMKPEPLRRLFDRLTGRKHLVVGNHDDANTRALPWETVQDIAYVSIDSIRIVLCHYPMLSWNGSRKGALQLYGHHHGKLQGNQQSCDIGVDVLGFAPVRLADIKRHMATLPPRVDPEAGDDFEAEVPTP